MERRVFIKGEKECAKLLNELENHTLVDRKIEVHKWNILVDKYFQIHSLSFDWEDFVFCCNFLQDVLFYGLAGKSLI